MPFRQPLRTLVLVLGWCAVALPGVSTAQGSRPDQIQWKDERGRTRSASGTLKQATLEGIRIETSRGEKAVEPTAVLRVVFGDVPAAYTEGMAYFERRDWDNAAQALALAAGDEDARPFVRARSRLFAARALLQAGAKDPSAFQRAVETLQIFLRDHPDDFELPLARLELGRAQRLAGNPAAAAETYHALYREAAAGDPPPGYRIATCLRAGLGAARAYLAADRPDAARELFANLEASVTRALADLDANAPERWDLAHLQTEARLGEGFCLLAQGDVSQAKTFFNGQIASADHNPFLRFGAKLGLADALLAEGQAAQAQIEFAQVSAIDHTDRDRVARALIGLAECALQLGYDGAAVEAKQWLQTVRDHYGDTPAVLRAQVLSQSF